MVKAEGMFDLSEVKGLIRKEQELTEAEAYLAECSIDASEIRRYALATEDCNRLCNNTRTYTI